MNSIWIYSQNIYQYLIFDENCYVRKTKLLISLYFQSYIGKLYFQSNSINGQNQNNKISIPAAFKKRVVCKETFRNSYSHIDDVHLLNVFLAFVFDFFLQILQILQLCFLGNYEKRWHLSPAEGFIFSTYI